MCACVWVLWIFVHPGGRSVSNLGSPSDQPARAARRRTPASPPPPSRPPSLLSAHPTATPAAGNSYMVPTMQHTAGVDPSQQQQQQQQQQHRSTHDSIPSTKNKTKKKSALYRCIAPNGVAYRRSATVGDKVRERAGPYRGDLVVVVRKETRPLSGEEWLVAANGLWLPLSIDGDPKFEFVKFL